MAKALKDRKCKPCEGGVPPLRGAELDKLVSRVPGWKLKRERLVRRVEFEDFLTLMEFVNDVAHLAEEQGHHPDFCAHYNRLDLSLWTHAIDGLSENDFILAAKINELLGEQE